MLQPSIMVLRVLLNHKKQRAQNFEHPVLLKDKSVFFYIEKSAVFYIEIEVSPQATMFISNYRSRRFWNSLIFSYWTSNDQMKQKHIFTFSYEQDSICCPYHIRKSRNFKERTN